MSGDDQTSPPAPVAPPPNENENENDIAALSPPTPSPEALIVRDNIFQLVAPFLDGDVATPEAISTAVQAIAHACPDVGQLAAVIGPLGVEDEKKCQHLASILFRNWAAVICLPSSKRPRDTDYLPQGIQNSQPLIGGVPPPPPPVPPTIAPANDTCITIMMVPAASNGPHTLATYFSASFGNVCSVVCTPAQAKASVRFQYPQGVDSVLHAQKALFDNRFVRVMWAARAEVDALMDPATSYYTKTGIEMLQQAKAGYAKDLSVIEARRKEALEELSAARAMGTSAVGTESLEAMEATCKSLGLEERAMLMRIISTQGHIETAQKTTAAALSINKKWVRPPQQQ